MLCPFCHETTVDNGVPCVVCNTTTAFRKRRNGTQAADLQEEDVALNDPGRYYDGQSHWQELREKSVGGCIEDDYSEGSFP